jgi:8-oxo-dGTP pyrophosphatase MutT (NUDIX family)
MAEKQRYTVLVRTLIFVFRDNKLLMMKYSGKGSNRTKEKADRKDVYNPIGGHVEDGEDIIENARKEAMEEAGIQLTNPKIKGVINVSGFAGKNMINFIVAAETDDQVLESTIEGELHWIKLSEVHTLNTFADIQPILDKLLILKSDETLVGVAQYDGFKLLDLRLDVH